MPKNNNQNNNLKHGKNSRLHRFLKKDINPLYVDFNTLTLFRVIMHN